jgi:DHA3 family macrolide efflux protein-like MFS transporter
VLRRPQFALLVIGQTVAQLGDRLHNMALIALVGTGADVRTSGIELAKLAIVFMLPTLFGPIVGALVDRWNKRATMLICHVLRAIIVLLIPWLYQQSGQRLWPVYVVAFFVGLFGAFFNSAKMAVIPDLVARGQLLSANAALTSIGRFATVAGVVGGGVMISWGIWQRIGWEGYEAGFYMDSAAYAISALTLVVISMLSAAHARRIAERHFSGMEAAAVEAAAVVKREFAHLAGDMRQTLGLIRRHVDLRFVFATVVLLGVLAASIYVIMTASVQTVMGQGTRGVGFLGGLLAGGMIVGSLFIGTAGSRWNKRHVILIGSLMMGLCMIIGALRYTYLVLVPVAFFGGLVLAPVMVSQDTLLHEAAPSIGRGLIFSTRDLVLGAVFMGWSVVVGSGIPILGAMGSDEPYRLALFILGVLICAAAMAGEVAVLRGRATRSGSRGQRASPERSEGSE